MKLLQDKTAIVTGAARGIGEAIAIKFAEHGANVAFTLRQCRQCRQGGRTRSQTDRYGCKARAYQSNAGDFSACEALVNDVLAQFGSVDICVNNAGISKTTSCCV